MQFKRWVHQACKNHSVGSFTEDTFLLHPPYSLQAQHWDCRIMQTETKHLAVLPTSCDKISEKNPGKFIGLMGY